MLWNSLIWLGVASQLQPLLPVAYGGTLEAWLEAVTVNSKIALKHFILSEHN